MIVYCGRIGDGMIWRTVGPHSVTTERHTIGILCGEVCGWRIASIA